MIQFDKSFHPVVLYENYLICIFMNINENSKQRTNGPVNAHLISWPGNVQNIQSNRKAMNRNWSNQKANPAFKTIAGNRLILQIDKIQ